MRIAQTHILLLLLWLKPIAAPAADSHHSTCSDCTTNGSMLLCNCLIGAGSTTAATQIDLNTCEPGTIWNKNGVLSCTAATTCPGNQLDCTSGGTGSPETKGVPSTELTSSTKGVQPTDLAMTGLPPMAMPDLPQINKKVDTSKAKNWQAQKHNDTLYQGEVDPATQTHLVNGANKLFINQNDTFTVASNVLFGCADHSLMGRTDAGCAGNPNDPECTGMLKSLQNATFCATPPPPGSPPNAPCLSYGSGGYVLEEWLVFSQQFYNSMSACVGIKDGADGTDARGTKIISLTDMASLTLGNSMGNNHNSGKSTVTGKTEKEKAADAAEVRVMTLSGKYDDGSEQLGYEKGEVFKQAVAGASFIKLFENSPFAEKLASENRELVVGSLTDPKDTMDRVKEKQLAQKEKNGETEGTEPAGVAEKTGSGNIMGELEKSGSSSTVTGKPETVSEKSVSGEKVAARLAELAPASDRSESVVVVANKGELGRTSLSIGPVAAITANSAAAAAASASAWSTAPANGASTLNIPRIQENNSTAEGRAPASAKGEESLFDRVRVSLRRYAPSMRESSTARDVRHTDSPAFFRDL